MKSRKLEILIIYAVLIVAVTAFWGVVFKTVCPRFMVGGMVFVASITSIILAIVITNPNCMRYKLLEFINSGQIEDKKQRDKLYFDSDFEEAVYNALVNKGYILTPQVKVGTYKIDLVVEGDNQRLGIECDGDKYHPPEKWFEDSLRQKQLERMGWTIYRIWGSDFYNRKDEIIEDIVNNLNKMGIYPKTFDTSQKILKNMSISGSNLPIENNILSK